MKSMLELNKYLSSLSKIKLDLSGNWKILSNVGKEWQGVITSEQPVVAITFMQVGNHVKWVKSERNNSEQLSVRFSFVKDNPNDKNMQMNYVVGDSADRCWTEVSSENYLSVLSNKNTFNTGEIRLLLVVDGSPKIELFSLFIQCGEIKIGRKGLWRLKDSIGESLVNPMKDILMCGRTGELNL